MLEKQGGVDASLQRLDKKTLKGKTPYAENESTPEWLVIRRSGGAVVEWVVLDDVDFRNGGVHWRSTIEIGEVDFHLFGDLTAVRTRGQLSRAELMEQFGLDGKLELPRNAD